MRRTDAMTVAVHPAYACGMIASPVNPLPVARPAAFPAKVPLVDTPRYSSSLSERWLDTEVAWVEYAKGDHRMMVSARIGDYNHVGNRVVGTFKEAVGAARVEAAIDEIDMPELGAAAVLRSHRKGEWIVVPLAGHAPGKGYGDDEPLTNLPIDPEHGSTYGPEGVWHGTGSGRGWRNLPESMDDAKQGALRVTAQRVHPDLVAIVGVDRWINFGSEHYADLLRVQ
jgi:hypothetical protein